MPVFQHHYSITTVHANELIDCVRSEVEKDGGKSVAVVVRDIFGHILATETPHDIKYGSFDFAIRKSHTVLQFNRATAEFRFSRQDDRTWVPNPDGWSDLDVATAMAGNPQFCAWAGGIPIVYGRQGALYTVGALGISNREELEDHDLAERSVGRWIMT